MIPRDFAQRHVDGLNRVRRTGYLEYTASFRYTWLQGTQTGRIPPSPHWGVSSAVCPFALRPDRKE